MSDCQMCELRNAMSKVMEIVESLPEIGVSLIDDAVTDVFNAADNAHGLLWHSCDEPLQLASRPTPVLADAEDTRR